MRPEDFQAVEAAFARLIAAEPDERDRLLEALAADDQATAQRVRAMLEAEQRTPAWLRDDDAGGGDDHPACASELEAPPQIEGFEVHRLIGRGGMGRVFEATQQTPHRRVAIKVLDEAHATAQSQPGFEREVNLLAGLQHPGVAAIYTGGRTAADEPWFAMEFVEGAPIDRAMALMTARRFIETFAKACEIVAGAHDQGVLHLDLKPDHIVIGPGGAPKVVDFGLARLFSAAEGAGSTSTAHIRGTLQYMSPQRLSAHKPAPSDDVYAMGVILRTLLGDEDGAGGPQFGALRRRALLRIARRAMAPEPEDRPPMRQMAASVRRAIRATLAYRSAVLGGAAALLLLIGGVGWMAAQNMGRPPRVFAGEGIYLHPLGPGMSLPESEFGAQLERARAGIPFNLDTEDPLSVWRQRALLAEATGELEEAREVLRYVIDNNNRASGAPAPFQNRLFLARVLTKLGERDEAAQVLASIEADLPALRPRQQRHLSTAVMITRALGLALDGRLDDAEAMMDDVMAVIETGWADWESQKTRGAWITYRAHRTMAEIADRRGDAELAAQHRQMGLVEATVEEPAILPLGPGLAIKRERLAERIARALAQVEEIEEGGAADHRLIEARLKLALLREAAEDYPGAEVECRRLLDGSLPLGPLDRFSVQTCLARSLARSERAGEAERLARRLLEEVTQSGVDAKRRLDIEAELYAALCLSLALQQKLDEALAAIENAFERLAPSSPRWIPYRTYRALAALADAHGNTRLAAECEAAAVDPEPPPYPPDLTKAFGAAEETTPPGAPEAAPPAGEPDQ
ncbi:MAG: protein kinase [Phycisphaerales bacterium JB039]